MQLPLRILFLCTGNSCRSIIAEALANALSGGVLQASSAGSRPTGTVHPRALAVLARHGIAPAAAASKSWDEFEHAPIDVLITVCDAAAGESCPAWLGRGIRARWGVPDPATAEGDELLIERVFERTYSQMRERIEAMLALPLTAMTAAELAAALGDIQRSFSIPPEHR